MAGYPDHQLESNEWTPSIGQTTTVSTSTHNPKPYKIINGNPAKVHNPVATQSRHTCIQSNRSHPLILIHRQPPFRTKVYRTEQKSSTRVINFVPYKPKPASYAEPKSSSRHVYKIGVQFCITPRVRQCEASQILFFENKCLRPNACVRRKEVNCKLSL